MRSDIEVVVLDQLIRQSGLLGRFELGVFDIPAFVNTDINKDFTENWSQIVDGIEGLCG